MQNYILIVPFSPILLVFFLVFVFEFAIINAIVLPAGTYLVTYGATGTRTTDGNLSAQLYANGSALANEIVSDNATSANSANLSKTILYTAAADGTTLSLYNTSGESVNLTGANITAVRIL